MGYLAGAGAASGTMAEAGLLCSSRGVDGVAPRLVLRCTRSGVSCRFDIVPDGWRFRSDGLWEVASLANAAVRFSAPDSSSLLSITTTLRVFLVGV